MNTNKQNWDSLCKLKIGHRSQNLAVILGSLHSNIEYFTFLIFLKPTPFLNFYCYSHWYFTDKKNEAQKVT